MTQTLIRPKVIIASPAGAEFLAGVRDTIPLIVGAIPFGMIFGTLAMSSGLSFAGTMAMSAIVFAGSAQFISLELLAAGTAWPFIVLTTFVVNLRHILYSATLAPYVTRLPQRWQVPLAFWLTDETFVVVANRYNQAGDSPHRRWYYLGSAIPMFINWQFSTFLGLTIGQFIPNVTAWGLDFALPITFIGMVIPYLKDRPMVAAVVASGVVAVLTYPMPNKLGLMVAALAGIVVGMVLETLSTGQAADG